jgi:bacteriocin-like protein
MKELTTKEMIEVQGGRSGALASAGTSGVKALSVGNVALAMNIDVNVLSGNGGGLNTLLEATASAGTASFSAALH